MSEKTVEESAYYDHEFAEAVAKWKEGKSPEQLSALAAIEEQTRIQLQTLEKERCQRHNAWVAEHGENLAIIARSALHRALRDHTRPGLLNGAVAHIYDAKVVKVVDTTVTVDGMDAAEFALDWIRGEGLAFSKEAPRREPGQFEQMARRTIH